MGLLEDIVKTLERIPAWKRLKDVPTDLDALRARVAAVEAQLAGGSGSQCPICQAPGFKVVSSVPHPDWGEIDGSRMDRYECPACQHSEMKKRTP